MRDIEKRVQELEVSVPKFQEDLATVKLDVAAIKETNKKLAKDIKEVQGSSKEEVTTAVFNEIRERENRRTNLVFHNIEEPDSGIIEKDERIRKDKDAVREVCSSIGVDLDIDEESRFVTRLGAARENGNARPLLIGLKTNDVCTKILEKASGLARMEEPMSRINIVRDLTANQRKEEKDLHDKAEKRNSELSHEEKGNWKWTVVGRRGERRIVKLRLEEEAVNQRRPGRPRRGGFRGRSFRG